ncbi:unnamed protein product [Candidula unifasciata]|uniref:Phosphatidylinositol-4,5-bisphosphate 4-phosphatase n=1 Tax=Candidula unifasciata TaxID=100452 RepID=A0A8S3Z613_9EUPU|nr:unnamed protein product [Candidula unifasciata]
MAVSERTPLLTGDNNEEHDNPIEPPAYSTSPGTGFSDAATLTVGTDELPPPYTPTAQGDIPMINCKVCQAIISLEGKQHLYVVKCSVCSEATPIRAAPPGKKYIRCPCNLLLVCRSGATKILCPRDTCKRVISLPSPTTDLYHLPLTSRYTCAYCHQVFMLRVVTKFVRCPHCRKLSSAGCNYARLRGHIYLLASLLIIGAAIGVTIEAAHQHGGIYVAWVGGFLVGVILLVRAIYYYTVKTSHLVQTGVNT